MALSLMPFVYISPNASFCSLHAFVDITLRISSTTSTVVRIALCYRIIETQSGALGQKQAMCPLVLVRPNFELHRECPVKGKYI